MGKSAFIVVSQYLAILLGIVFVKILYKYQDQSVWRHYYFDEFW